MEQPGAENAKVGALRAELGLQPLQGLGGGRLRVEQARQIVAKVGKLVEPLGLIARQRQRVLACPSRGRRRDRIYKRRFSGPSENASAARPASGRSDERWARRDDCARCYNARSKRRGCPNRTSWWGRAPWARHDRTCAPRPTRTMRTCGAAILARPRARPARCPWPRHGQSRTGPIGWRSWAILAQDQRSSSPARSRSALAERYPGGFPRRVGGRDRSSLRYSPGSLQDAVRRACSRVRLM